MYVDLKFQFNAQLAATFMFHAWRKLIVDAAKLNNWLMHVTTPFVNQKYQSKCQFYHNASIQIIAMDSDMGSNERFSHNYSYSLHRNQSNIPYSTMPQIAKNTLRPYDMVSIRYAYMAHKSFNNPIPSNLDIL